MQQVLVVEDSRTFASLLSRSIKSALDVDCTWATSLAHAEEILAAGAEDFFMALCDLNLPDAPQGEVVDLVLDKGLPAVVFTGELDPELCDRIGAKPIVDYVYKEGAENVREILDAVRDILSNPDKAVLVADQDPARRKALAELLQVRRYEVIEAQDAASTLALLKDAPQVRLVIAAYDLPDMSGCELARAVRRERGKDDLALIGLCEPGTPQATRFLKAGADDYMHAPVSSQELFCRVTQNLTALENAARIRRLAHSDVLTGLHDRTHFFDVGAVLHANQERNTVSLSAALVALDGFDALVEEHGHAAGDVVLKAVADTLRSRLRKSDLVGRYGGAEFCVLASNLERDHAAEVFEGLRQAVRDMDIPLNQESAGCTVSVGVCLNPMGSLDEMVAQAAHMLGAAKDAGGDQVRMFPEPM